MRKYDFISALAKETAAEVVKNREEWMKYLTTAARLYKYPFREQLLIYAQRPDATACASIELWNERMHCWVNKGAKGIALLDEDDAHGKRLKYVFDVSDVHAARRIGRYPELWELHEEHKEDVIKRLEQTYGATDDKKLFEERLMEIAERIAADYYEVFMRYSPIRINFSAFVSFSFAAGSPCISSAVIVTFVSSMCFPPLFDKKIERTVFPYALTLCCY